jgi:hypothetical protein
MSAPTIVEIKAMTKKFDAQRKASDKEITAKRNAVNDARDARRAELDAEFATALAALENPTLSDVRELTKKFESARREADKGFTARRNALQDERDEARKAIDAEFAAAMAS